MTPAEARARFVEARVAYLATTDSTGVPHVVPITFAVEADRIYTAVDAKPKRPGPLKRFANVAANARVAILVDAYDEDWSALWWARADGIASVLTTGASLEHALGLLRARYPQYQGTRLSGPAIVVRVERWSGWSSAEG
jgi:PPOX class probable F420-dependent enzyme